MFRKKIVPIIKNMYKTPIIYKLFIIFTILLILSLFYKRENFTHKKEGFQQREKFVLKEGPDIYDDFYADIYDELVYDVDKNKFEIGEIIRYTNITPNNSIVLDIGSGSGHHVNELSKKNIKCEGIDKSKSMVARSNKLYPSLSIKESDALDALQFQPHTFTHIQCLYFTIYYISNKQQLFENCFNWLKPGGYLALHLVNRDMFDPILNVSNPLHMVSPQKYAKERITNSIVKFKDFQYKADFKYKKGDNKAYFEETFKDDITGNVRKNNHIFYMETQKQILEMAKKSGFIMHAKIDLVAVQYEYQYIYILQKPH